MHAHLIGVMTGKGLENTAYGRDVIEKAGVTYASAAPNIATEVSGQIEKEIMRELPRTRSVISRSTLNTSTANPARHWSGYIPTGAATSGNLTTRGGASSPHRYSRHIV